MSIELIPVSEEYVLLERAKGLEWEIDRHYRNLAILEKERREIIEHCLRMGIMEANEYRLVRRQGVVGDGPDSYRVERIERE